MGTSRFLFEALGHGFYEDVPLGNGALGAMIPGDPRRECITLNHSALWSGCAHDAVNPLAKNAIPLIRDAYFSGRYAEADDLAQKCLMSALPHADADAADTPFGAYLPLGELEIFCDRMSADHPADYKRMLDISTGICSAEYRIGGTRFSREYFTSFAEPVFAFRFRSENAGAVSAVVRLRRMLDACVSVLPDGILKLCGTVSGGNHFCTFAKVRTSGGTLDAMQDGFSAKNADTLEVIVSASTSLIANDPEADAEKILHSADLISFDDLRARHTAEFQKENGDFELNIGPEPENAESVSTFFECLQNHTFPGFCAARFASFSRYLLLSSSRPGNLPATIQGIWSDAYRPPWNCDYHLNGNTQMIYWPAEACGLSGNHLPLLNWLKTLAEAGAQVARDAFGARGWCAAWTSNPFGYAAPGKCLDWGLFPEAGAWMCMHIRDHFEYTRDMDFLRSFYPVLQGACAFCLDMLAPDPQTGKLLFGPTVAPEHGFLAPDGSRHLIAWGTTTAQECVWELFRFTLEAGALIVPDDPLLNEIRSAFELLALPTVDADGMIGKWIHPLTPDGCRHLRHVMGLYPGTRLAQERTPEMTSALENTLLDHENASRQSYWGAGSWSGGWLVNLWARLGNGKKAEEALMLLMQKTLSPNMLALNSNVFQLDGHCGSLSGILEMLVQERDGKISLLPALPEDWRNGSVRGLHLRGGRILNMDWKDGKPVFADKISDNTSY